jgi:primosomal protein N' (replication factor Y)
MNSIANTEVISVLLPLPVDEGFYYLLPADKAAEVQVGTLVKAMVQSRLMMGVVVARNCQLLPEEKTRLDGKIREIESVLALPPLHPNLIEFITWVANYNMTNAGNVLKMVLSGLGQRKRIQADPKLQALPGPESSGAKVELSEQQHKVAESLIAKLGQGHSVTLLDGVTGSGKTEVYLEVIECVLENGGQVLVLLPEIVLTSQLIQRFAKRFDFMPCQWHSSLSQKQRYDTWRLIQKGAKEDKASRFIVGARSALFLPFANLQLIVIDEEHDQSFKQEEGVIYNARDMAIVRAKVEGIPVLLSSATPSVETVYNMREGKYNFIELPKRYGKAVLPKIELVDMRQHESKLRHLISPYLHEKMIETIANGRQVLLFLNRRGYAPITLCIECGHRVECPNCSSLMVEHRRKHIMQCHYCGKVDKVPQKCSKCESDKIITYGPGVEKLEEEVEKLLPNARTALLTSDSVADHDAANLVLNAISNHEVDVIIGTQMIAKGLHFPKLHLVGVIDADASAMGGDIRIIEKTYQLLHQVAGRAGRENEQGLVLIQSYDPNNSLLQNLASGDRQRFLDCELEDRKAANMPPFSRLAMVILSSYNEKTLFALNRQLLATAPHLPGVSVMGPSPCPLFVLRKKYRYRFILNAEKKVNVQKLIKNWLAMVKVPASVKVKVDVDPYSFL